MVIKRIQAKWTVNGKEFDGLDALEKQHLVNFILYMQENHQVATNKPATNSSWSLKDLGKAIMAMAIFMFLIELFF